MVKGKKARSIPEKSKKVEAPSVVHRNLMDILQTTVDKATLKYNRVDIASSPYITTKQYLDNYSGIFGHE